MSEIAVHFDSAGTGVPLVLLPAFPLDGRMWRTTQAEMDGWILTVDPPGFGDSASPRALASRLGVSAEPSLGSYARGIAAALDELGVERAAFAGCSMGGYTIMAFAQLFPERIAGVGLVGTKSAADTDEQREARYRMAEFFSGAGPHLHHLTPLLENVVSADTRMHHEDVYGALASWFEQAPAAGVAWAQRAMAARSDGTAALAALDVPAVVIRGTQDALSSLDDARVMADALGVTVHEIQGAGHLAPIEAPRRVAFLLEEMWQRAQG